MAVVLLVLIMIVTYVQKWVQHMMEKAESRPVKLTVTTEQNTAAKAMSARAGEGIGGKRLWLW